VYFNKIRTDNNKSLFLRTASFYLFLVKQGNWVINISDRNKVLDYITNTYKFIAIFSLIESLSVESFMDFYQFILRRKYKVRFPMERATLDEIYKSYKNEFGSIKRCISFFKALTPNRQKELISRLKIKESKASIENFAKYLYELRSKFIHEAELVHHMSEGKTVSIKQGHLVVCSLSISDAMLFFEEGLIEHFRE
jgi:hypothetical protein